ncbi:MAG TPA: nucleoside transporter C-terminal domain-containing protein [Tepidisphaeraceae bacterium]|nr:nucleoside transporter C-terminal domain-containing protein [Tepidisphaeraceae bacterium]
MRWSRLGWILALLLFAAPTFAQLAPPAIPPGTALQKCQSALGYVVFISLAFLIGRICGHRKTIRLRTLFWGAALEFLFAIIVIRPPTMVQVVEIIIGIFSIWVVVAYIIRRTTQTRLPGSDLPLLLGAGALFLLLRLPNVLDILTEGIKALLGFAQNGAEIVFGNLTTSNIPVGTATGPMGDFHAMAGHYAFANSYFAFFILPTIIFFSCLTTTLYYIGIVQYMVQGLAWIMSKTMGTSGAETLCAVINIFVGQTEAPLMVKPFLAAATNSELMAMMVAGFGNIASGVLALYTLWLAPFIPDAAGHLAAACFISAPSSLLIAKMLFPELSKPETAAGVKFKIDRLDANLVDAATRGTLEGLTLALNVAAMLITFTGLVALVDVLLTTAVGYNPLAHYLNVHHHMHLILLPVPTLEQLFGYIFRPLAWLTGVSWHESGRVGTLLGIKTVLNELIAYSNMKTALAANAHFLSPRARLLALYSLCGFANFASVGIQVGGIATMAPTRRSDLSRIGLLAMLGGAISSLTAACIVGVLV